MSMHPVPAPVLEWIDEIADRFESAWRSQTTPPRIADFLGDAPNERRSALLEALVLIDLEYRNETGSPVTLESYAAEFSELRDANGGILARLRVASANPNEIATASKLLDGETTFHLRCRQCDQPLPAMPLENKDVQCAKCGAMFRYAWADPSGAVKLPAIADHEIIGVLGKGGMGIVYKAQQVSLKRTVAIKMILGGGQIDGSRVARFRQEALALAQLQHPHTVQIFEIGEHDGCPFFSMEFVNGGTLSQKLVGKPMPSNEAAALAQTLARAMHAAHQKGIIHRDLKPANVMLAEDGTPKITDFGLAKQLDADQALSHTGDIMGTPSYMAPEQALGRTDKIGPATDIYALGAILYETLTGRPPFRGKTTMETLDLVRNQEPISPRSIEANVPRDLETICLKCLRKEPAQRYSSALELAQDLERFVAGEAILARPEGVIAKVARRLRRHRVVAALGMALVVAMIAAAVVGYQSRQSRLIRDIDAQLEVDRAEAKWTDDAIRAHEALIAQLAQHQSDRANEARASLHESLFQSANKRLQQATALQPDDDAEVRRVIMLLEPRNSELAEKLRHSHQARLRAWEEVFAYSPIAPSDARLRAYTGFLKPSDTILTNQRAQGDVRLEATWDAWDSATQIGLTLNSEVVSERTGYAFVLNANGSLMNERKKLVNAAFGNLRNEEGSVTLSILRNGVNIRKLEIPGSRLPIGPIRMEVERVGDRLRVHVENDIVLETRDIIPLPPSGFYGVVMPAKTGLASLRGLRQALPSNPGPLEQGDELFAQNRFEDARVYYGKRATESAGSAAGYEARFKEALTLDNLNRKQDAVPIYEALAGEMKTNDANRWTVLAAFQLWAHYLKTGKREEASVIGERLLLQQSLGKGEKLASYVSEELRNQIRRTYFWDAGSFGLLRHRPKRLENILQVVKLEEVFDTPPTARRGLQLALMRAERFEGNIDRAIQAGQKVLNDPSSELYGNGNGIAMEFGWAMREKGYSAQAVKAIDIRLFDKAGRLQRVAVPLFIERARLNAAMKKWADARKDIDAYFAANEDEKGSPALWLEACLVLGMICEQQNDMDGARAAWLKGYTRATTEVSNQQRSGHFAINEMLLAMLCQKLDEKHIEKVARPVLGNQFDLLAFIDTKSLFRKSATMMNRAVQTPKVMDIARQFVLQTCTLREYVHYPAQVAIVELIRDEAFKEKATDEQDLMLWQLGESVAHGFSSGKLNDTQAMQILLLWKRGPSILGGIEILQTFDPELRGPGAYFMGLRFQRLGRPPEQAFQMAAKAAPANSPLERLAQGELEKLKKTKAK